MTRTPKLQKPPLMRPTDRVGLFAPSFPTAAQFPARFDHGVAAIEREFGAEVVIPTHVRVAHGDRSGRPEDLAASFTEMACDPTIGAIFATIGGHGAAELLPFLDPQVLAEHPTIVVGYSDLTSLLLGLNALAGWCTFHGPTLMTDLAEAPAPHPFTLGSLRRAITESAPVGILMDPDTWTAEHVDWGTDAWRRGRVPQGSGARSVWQVGTGRGLTYGGNLEALVHLTGTRAFSPPDDVVLFLETTGTLTTPPTVRQALVHLQQVGLIGRARAVLLGRCPEFTPATIASVRSTIRELVGPSVPVVADLPFGHHSPIWTVPIGVEASVEVSDERSTIAILEAGVV